VASLNFNSEEEIMTASALDQPNVPGLRGKTRPHQLLLGPVSLEGSVKASDSEAWANGW